MNNHVPDLVPPQDVLAPAELSGELNERAVIGDVWRALVVLLDDDLIIN